MISNFGGLYKNIGMQDQLEQELSDAEMEKEEKPKSGGFFGGFFNMGGASMPKPAAKKTKLSDELSSGLFQASKMNAKKFTKK